MYNAVITVGQNIFGISKGLNSLSPIQAPIQTTKQADKAKYVGLCEPIWWCMNVSKDCGIDLG